MRVAGDQIGGIVGQRVLCPGKADLVVQMRRQARSTTSDSTNPCSTAATSFSPKTRGSGFSISIPWRCAIEFIDAALLIGMDEVFELPFVTKYVGHQDTVLAALFVAHLVAACHHRSDARVQAIFEMRQIDSVQCALVGADIDPEAGILHRIDRKMLVGGDEIWVWMPVPWLRPSRPDAKGLRHRFPARGPQRNDAAD